MIRLEEPSTLYSESFFAAMAEFEAEGRPQIASSVGPADFSTYIGALQDLAAGRNLKPGYIPSKEFWMIDEDGWSGRIILGLTYHPTPARLGHHVGYAVRPSRRRRGYATEALRLLLDQAMALGIYRLMPTCGKDNIASIKVIEANGGIRLPSPNSNDSQDDELRFLILLGPEARSTQ